MAVPRLGVKSSIAARQRAGVLASEDKAWQNSSGSLRGEPGRATFTGYLPAEHRDAVRAATYVVYSYSTPIAWRNAAGQWTCPEVRYSATTSKHQGVVRAWVVTA